MRRLPCWIWVLASIVALALRVSVPAAETSAATDRGSQAVAEILGRVETSSDDEFWADIRRLESLGSAVSPALVSGLSGTGERSRLACAKALLAVGNEAERNRALGTIAQLARTAVGRDTRVAAIDLFSREGDPDEALEVLGGVLKSATDPDVLIPTAKSLWELDRVREAREKLLDLLGSQDGEVKLQAALALAEIDYFEGEVREVLRQLKAEPSELGRRAQSLDKIIRLSRELDAGGGKAGISEGADAARLLEIKEGRIRELEEKLQRAQKPDGSKPRRSDALDSVIDEVILQIQESYVDASKTDRRKLVVSALKGMVHDLDDFSSFMDSEETSAFRQNMAGEYQGIGAQVHKPVEGPLEVLKPIYGGPAFKAGILSGDQILEVNGLPTADKDIQDVVEQLQGPESSTVTLKVARRGWTEPKEFTIERRRVEVPSVYAEMLPGKVGYVHLQQFGEKSADEFIGALDLLESQGMAGLILDLRNDPGGRLDIAIRIVDQFVAGSLPIVTQKGRGQTEGTQAELPTYPDPFVRGNYPMVVLINEKSASASEILAGALQDFQRATLVGKKTFGKGSVQRLIPLSTEAVKALGGESQLRLTVQYYFLPLGRCIHTLRDKDGTVIQEGGVRPDIEVDAEKTSLARLEERERLRTHADVLDYAARNAEALQQLYLEGDGRDPARYPGFEELFGKVGETATREDLRLVLRYHGRRRLEDKNGKEFACDFREDAQLQRAILEVLKKLGEDPEALPAYAGLFKKA